jgi:hypothetical protein
MDIIFEDFRKAYEEGNGYDLSQTLSPLPPPSDPDRLYNFFRSTNFAQVKADFKYRILYDGSSPFKLPAEEGNGWVEVYWTYWKALGEILNAENATKANAKVHGQRFLQIISQPLYKSQSSRSHKPHFRTIVESCRESRDWNERHFEIVRYEKTLNCMLTQSQASWTKVYDSWKEMTNALIRGYTNCGFEAWTVPCLYVAGKYMRIFAIKADEGTATPTGSVTNFDDFNPESEKNEKLEDAARQLNRIFQICLADRYVFLSDR